jgi:hypothetical protein
MSAGTDLVVSDQAALEADPVEYMSVVLNRAKGWLTEAASIEDVRHEKAIAVGYESVIREKELAFDAQLSATEIVRRCERRIGELVREGQERGEIRKRGEGGGDRNFVSADTKVSPADVFTSGHMEQVHSYAMADAPAEQFEQAVTEAREEGNLSRANVVRKVKGEPVPAPKRSEWHNNRRKIDSNRILTALAQELDGATSGLELMEREALDPEIVAECIASIKRSLADINRHLRRIQ